MLLFYKAKLNAFIFKLNFKRGNFMLEQIRTLIANQLNLPLEKVQEDSKIIEDLGADSLDIVEMLMTLEEEFGISLSDEQATQMKTVKDIYNIINKLK